MGNAQRIWPRSWGLTARAEHRDKRLARRMRDRVIPAGGEERLFGKTPCPCTRRKRRRSGSAPASGARGRRLRRRAANRIEKESAACPRPAARRRFAASRRSNPSAPARPCRAPASAAPWRGEQTLAWVSVSAREKSAVSRVEQQRSSP